MPDFAPETWLLMLMAMSFLGVGAAAMHGWMSARNIAPPAPAEAPAPAPTDREAFQVNSQRLVSEAAAILRLIRSQLAAGDRFSTSLAEADRNLPKLATPEQVRTVIKFLIAENAKMQEEANELKTNLEESQAQIDRLRSNLAEAEEMGLRDPLTSLGNRRSFDLNLASAVAEAYAKSTPLCLVMCDLDNFKKINDAYGHQVGDEVLKVFGSVLAENLRAGDSVARYGGEEFAVILCRSNAEGAARLTERMRMEMEIKRLALNRNGELIGNITASFGVAQLCPGDTVETLVQRADAKLYEAKSAGRNRVVVDATAAQVAA